MAVTSPYSISKYDSFWMHYDFQQMYFREPTEYSTTNIGVGHVGSKGRALHS